MSVVTLKSGSRLKSVSVRPFADCVKDSITIECPGRKDTTIHFDHDDLVSLMSDIIESRLVRLNPVLS